MAILTMAILTMAILTMAGLLRARHGSTRPDRRRRYAAGLGRARPNIALRRVAAPGGLGLGLGIALRRVAAPGARALTLTLPPYHPNTLTP
eukprot:scaffold57166_cov51-Phaeocystis_antarctica.AAC.2